MQKEKIKKIFLYTFFSFVSIVTIVFVTLNFRLLFMHGRFDEQEILSSLQACDYFALVKKEDCLEQSIGALIVQFPTQTKNILQNTWNLLKEEKISADPRIFSDIAHEAGMILIQKKFSLAQAFTACGYTFKQGCIHGAVMEYIDTVYQKNISASSLFKVCKPFVLNSLLYTNCLHGVGHELTAKLNAPLSTLLHECDRFTHIQEQDACASGIFMEYSKGTAGSGEHSHETVGRVALPCDKVDEPYKDVCYASAGSYRQYTPGQESFTASFQFCLEVPSASRESCLSGLADRVWFAGAGKHKKVETLCKSLESVELQSACLGALF